jgi:hypothetical protein
MANPAEEIPLSIKEEPPETDVPLDESDKKPELEEVKAEVKVESMDDYVYCQLCQEGVENKETVVQCFLHFFFHAALVEN